MACSAFDIITGQIPAHGETYWTQREMRLETRLRLNLMDPRTRLRLAEARAALGRRGEALSVLASLEKIGPADSGAVGLRAHVLEEMGEAGPAAELLATSLLAISDVCPGLGDFHLRALQWSAAPQKDRTFTGERYATWPAPGTLSADGYSRLLVLAARRPQFPDAMLVLGDELCRRGAPNLAIWAWVRALDLGHPAKHELRRRLETTFFLWRVGPGRVASQVDDTIAIIRRHFATAGVWLGRFQRVEMQLVLEGREPALVDVLAECTKRGIRKVAASDCDEFPVTAAELAAAAPAQEPARASPGAPPSLDPWTESALKSLVVAAGTLFLACLAGFILSCFPPLSPRKSRALTLSRHAQRVQPKKRGPPMLGGLCAC
ncbi:MAG: hypothetical protein FD180_1065 [Planctomycetota bacterium]|nr:MAG: hypothetical protein FD180_1065 [Planctomycetota bacterium]